MISTWLSGSSTSGSSVSQGSAWGDESGIPV